MGGVLSRENKPNQGAGVVRSSGRQHGYGRKGEIIRDPVRSETSSTGGNSMRENREIPCLFFESDGRGRAGKVNDRTPATDGYGKSDNSILLAKPPNKAGQPTAEVV